MASNIYQVLKRPVVTEKTTALRESVGNYVFEVAPDANKIEIRQAVEKLFGVRVADVRTSVVRGKFRRTRKGLGRKPNWKKAVVTLVGDDSIELFEGI